MSENQKNPSDEIGSVEVEPLTDADLDTVSGGFSAQEEIVNNASTGCATSNAANACC